MTCSRPIPEIPEQTDEDPSKFNQQQLIIFLEQRLTEEKRVHNNAEYNIPELQKTIDALKAIA
jgi:hypothetical protein